MLATNVLAGTLGALWAIRLMDAHMSAAASQCLDRGDVDLPHSHHRIEGEIRGRPIGAGRRVQKRPRG